MKKSSIVTKFRLFESTFNIGERNNFEKPGINWQAEFTTQEMSQIEGEIFSHVSDLVIDGFTSGDVNGALYKGWWEMKLDEKMDSDDAYLVEVSRLISEGNIEGIDAEFTLFVNIWSEADKKIIESVSTTYVNTTRTIDGFIVAKASDEFTGNPLFYVYIEYPTYKVLNDNKRLVANYELYTDDKGNKYFLYDGVLSDDDIKAHLTKKKEYSGLIRNVDAFVNGADKDDYARWLEAIK